MALTLMDDDQLPQRFLNYRRALLRELEATKGRGFVENADLEIMRIESEESFRFFWSGLTTHDRELWTRRLRLGYEGEKQRSREIIDRTLSSRHAA